VIDDNVPPSAGHATLSLTWKTGASLFRGIVPASMCFLEERSDGSLVIAPATRPVPDNPRPAASRSQQAIAHLRAEIKEQPLVPTQRSSPTWTTAA
jgi:hypothetical protein